MNLRPCKKNMWIKGKMQGCGYRMTEGRDAIFDVLSKNKEKHLSADEIYMKVHPLFPSVGLTTVYRTLEVLKEMGIVSKFDFGEGRARYELVSEKDENHHHHLVCTSCKTIINYTDFIDDELELLKRTEKSLSKKYNFEIKNHVIQFYGICEKCR